MKKMNEIENSLRTLLRNNIVAFTYRKVDGSIRHALGTRNLGLASRYTQTEIPTPNGEEQPTSYYDVQSNGWRSWKEGNVISIDGCRVGWRATELGWHGTETPKKGELPKREIPISKPTTGGVSGGKPMGGADIDNLGGLLGGLLGGFGGGFARPSKEEIRKAMDDLDKDIDIVPPMGGVSGGKVGTPTFTDKGLELETGVAVEDFAKMVAHYVVEEFISRIKQL